MLFLTDYGLFLLKTTTLAIAILVVVTLIISLSTKSTDKEKLEVKNLNKKYKDLAKTIKKAILHKTEIKKLLKLEKKIEKKSEKKPSAEHQKKLFVVDFEGDIKASAVHSLREIITAILQVATTDDEVLINLESGGGVVHGYGLAASQLQRLRQQNISLTVAVDKVAASGGYLMACVANKIIAAPFAIIGSIGVLAQLPNFNRYLKKHNIEFEQITAGEYKRTLTMFGENTSKGREKFKEDLEEIHEQFKDHITSFRPHIDIEKVATGEHWLAVQAKKLHLVDDLITSDDYLLKASENCDLYHISYVCKKSLIEKVSSAISLVIQRVVFDRLQTNEKDQIIS